MDPEELAYLTGYEDGYTDAMSNINNAPPIDDPTGMKPERLAYLAGYEAG